MHSVNDNGEFFSGPHEGITHIEVSDVEMPESTSQGAISIVMPHELSVETADVTDKLGI